MPSSPRSGVGHKLSRLFVLLATLCLVLAAAIAGALVLTWDDSSSQAAADCSKSLPVLTCDSASPTPSKAEKAPPPTPAPAPAPVPAPAPEGVAQ